MAWRWLTSVQLVERRDGRDSARQPLFSGPCDAIGGQAELATLRHPATIDEVLQRYPEVLSQITAFVGRPEHVLRDMRLWSPSFLQFCSEEPTVAVPLERLTNTVTSGRVVQRSDRERRNRLLLSGGWVLLFGVAAPVYTLSWVLMGTSPAAVYRLIMLVLATVSMTLALCMPVPDCQAQDLQDAVFQLASEIPRHSRLSGRRMAGASSESAEVQATDSQSSIGASTGFVQSMKRGMLVSSCMGILVALWPLGGLCSSCCALLVAALSWGRFVGYDIKLSVLKMFQPERASISVLSRGGEEAWEHHHGLMQAQWEEDERLAEQRVGALPENSRLDAVKAVTSTCFCICAFRSLILWVSAAHGCSCVDQDVHDSACLPSLVAMMCPGFLVVASLVRLGMAQRGCCDTDGACFDADAGAPRLRCYIASGVYLCIPLWAMNLAAFLLVMRWLGAVSKMPVVTLMRGRPVHELVLVSASIVALWVALLMFSTVISACVRILASSSAIMGFGMLSAAYLVMEMLLMMLVQSEGKNFLPKMMMISSAISTGVLALVSIGYVVYKVVGVSQAQPSQRSQEPLLFLWG